MRSCILVFLCFLVNPFELLAEKDKLAFEKNSEILVITNRVTHLTTSKSPIFENTVDTSGQLKFYTVRKDDERNLELFEMTSSDLVSKMVTTYNNWVLFVHGDSKTFEDAVLRGFKIQELHHVNVVVFSWPSKQNRVVGSKNFRISKKHVEQSLEHFSYLIHFFKHIRESHHIFFKKHSLSLFMHSLGNYYLELFIKKKQPLKSTPIVFDNIIINAAAVSQRHHKSWVNQLQMQENIFIISNTHDFNLKGLRLFAMRGRQLGEVVRVPFSEKAYYINFTRSVGFRFPTGTTHTYFINAIPKKSDNIRLFYTEILHGRMPDLTDEQRFEISKKHKEKVFPVFKKLN